ncbi:MAG: DUF815 domain-containing protein [Firmicutes bacterium]|nr:DUF815 domain-containing protein [Bacillota bacterium]
MNLIDLFYKLSSLTVFRGFHESKLWEAFVSIAQVEDPDSQGESWLQSFLLNCYGEFCGEVLKSGGNISSLIKDYVLGSEDLPFAELSSDNSSVLRSAINFDLEALQELSELTSAELKDFLFKVGRFDKEDTILESLPKWDTSSMDLKSEFFDMLNSIGTGGYGIFRKNIMFKIKDGKLKPIENADYQDEDTLYGYERERSLIMKNTEAFAKGLPASNVLLYGDAGTGKSTSAKTCSAAYSAHGVRLIEFTKEQVTLIPEIAEELSKSPLKFIFFIDDLTFNEDDSDFYALKGILEGNVSGTGSNILIYATSNRRHLIKESSASRHGDDLHLNDTLQEVMSLASRFGLTITFSKPAKDLYISIVKGLAKEYGLEVTDDLITRAEAFAIRANGRSPRTAKQFIILASNDLQ